MAEPPPYSEQDPSKNGLNPDLPYPNQNPVLAPPHPNPNSPPPAFYPSPVNNEQTGNYYTYLPPGVTTITPGAQPSSSVIIHSAGFRNVPVTSTCIHCNMVVTSNIRHVTGSFTWMMCCITFIFCPLFCWLIPFCVLGTKDVHHYCPNCHHLMGTHSQM